jgi:ubiquinone/menaquinone biosynthesis C-methylase UbiE
MKTKIFFKKRIPEPEIMEKVEYDEFTKVSFLNYKRWFVILVEDLVQWFIKLRKKTTNLSKGDFLKICDIGCGPGYLLIELVQNFKNAEIIGVDYADYILKVAKKNIKTLLSPALRGNIKLINADVHKLPFPEEYFDIVVCKDSLHHFKDVKTALKEIVRVVKKGGIVYIQDLRRDLPFYLLKMAIPPNTVFKKLQYYSARASYTKEEIKKILIKTFKKEIKFFIKTRKLNKNLIKKCIEMNINPKELRYSFQSRFVCIIYKKGK